MFTERKVYIIGIGGISLSALALILKDMGKSVFGSDLVASKITKDLSNQGIKIKIGHAPDYVKESDVVIISSAISDDDEDLILARSMNKKIYSRAEILGMLSTQKKCISVSGTHGKTTTTGMISSILLSADKDPTIHIGGILNNIHSNLRIGESDLLVTEACEYKDSFLTLSSHIGIILNIEEDHLDYFKNIDNIFSSFNKFIENIDKNGTIIYNFDDLDGKIKLPRKTLSFGLKKRANVHAKNISQYTDGKYKFDVYFNEDLLATIYLPCFGKHNILNALASIATALTLNIDIDYIKEGIENYKGVERRFEEIRERDNRYIIHDYAHHPKEIISTLKACRDIKPKGKVIAVFQPHTFTRTRDLYNEFLNCFFDADEVWLLPIYPAREKPIAGINSSKLASDLEKNGKKTLFFDNFDSCRLEIEKRFLNSDIIIILGAGDIEKLAYSLN